MPLRVAIAEDSVILRDGLVQLLLDRGFEVTAAVADADALRDAIGRERPDVAVVDIRMPPSFTDEGLRVAIELRGRVRGTGDPDVLAVHRDALRRGAPRATMPPASDISSRTTWPT